MQRMNAKARITHTRPFSQNAKIPTTSLFQSAFGERKWLTKHGKQKFIMFNDDSLLELRKYFGSLDEHGSGQIGIAELEDPFLALGLSQGREEIEELIKTVDLDGSGKIQFDQFVIIMSKLQKAKQNNTQKLAIYEFFQKMRSDKEMDNNVPFRLNVSQYRRRRILESIMSKDSKDPKDLQKKEKGTKIMQAFKRQIKNTKDYDLKKGINSNGLQTFNRIFPRINESSIV